LLNDFSILNAYYFPDQDYSDLYDSISPVNSFRVVLNRYLGAAYPILEDLTFGGTHEPFTLNDETIKIHYLKYEELPVHAWMTMTEDEKLSFVTLGLQVAQDSGIDVQRSPQVYVHLMDQFQADNPGEDPQSVNELFAYTLFYNEPQLRDVMLEKARSTKK